MCLKSSLRIALMGELFDVVDQAVQLPLRVDLDATPKRSLGGMTPTQYAKQLAIKAVTMGPGSKVLRY